MLQKAIWNLYIFEKYVSHMRHLFDKIPIRNAYLIVRIYLSPGIHLAIAIQSALTEQPDQLTSTTHVFLQIDTNVFVGMNKCVFEQINAHSYLYILRAVTSLGIQKVRVHMGKS